MHAIVTVLKQPYYTKIRQIWYDIEQECGLTGIKITPIPHFSWHIAQAYDLDQLQSVVRSLAAPMAPFDVKTAGLGIFTGERPVVYIPLVLTSLLSDFHEMVWGRVGKYSQDAGLDYAPESWMPHITLAHADVDPEGMSCLARRLAFIEITWRFQVDNLALVWQDGNQVGELAWEVPFGG